jgi:hypothetical protein
MYAFFRVATEAQTALTEESIRRATYSQSAMVSLGMRGERLA